MMNTQGEGDGRWGTIFSVPLHRCLIVGLHNQAILFVGKSKDDINSTSLPGRRSSWVAPGAPWTPHSGATFSTSWPTSWVTSSTVLQYLHFSFPCLKGTCNTRFDNFFYIIFGSFNLCQFIIFLSFWEQKLLKRQIKPVFFLFQEYKQALQARVQASFLLNYRYAIA